jgi:excisionase family DNA binding protein
MSQEVMTIAELATYLDLAESTIYKKVQTHEIPFTKLGNLLRFTKTSIDAWLDRNTEHPDDSLFNQFARLQGRYHFLKWLEGRKMDWRTLTDELILELCRKAIADLRQGKEP